GLVRGDKAEAVRHPVRRADEIETEAPEVAGVGGAVAVGGVAGKLRALDRFPRLGAGHRSKRSRSQNEGELRARIVMSRQICGASARTRFPGLVWDVGEEVAEPGALLPGNAYPCPGARRKPSAASRTAASLTTSVWQPRRNLESVKSPERGMR